MGEGRRLEINVGGGIAGLIIDMRFTCAQDSNPALQEKWMIAMGAYTQQEIHEARRQAREIN